MNEPVIAQKAPKAVELEAGKAYYWCTCGRSANQPFCDGSHKDTAFVPMKFEVQESRKYGLCACKHSGNKPFCDGAHRSL